MEANDYSWNEDYEAFLPLCDCCGKEVLPHDVFFEVEGDLLCFDCAKKYYDPEWNDPEDNWYDLKKVKTICAEWFLKFKMDKGGWTY